ncbi:unnamed protein product [Adineta ricciae]|uniref:Uncharacterized protein n=1 Tax=Adineta ricciae TaxID=249248 RepID=A0A815GNN7_ADIRI|nr:unnamed protein product [Adineta ricciae]
MQDIMYNDFLKIIYHNRRKEESINWILLKTTKMSSDNDLIVLFSSLVTNIHKYVGKHYEKIHVQFI